MDKVYAGSMFFGATTPSFDAETEIDNVYDTGNINEDLLQSTTAQFTGEIEQIPPAYSAIKVDGKRAFELARKNKSVELKSRKVTISSFQLLNIDLPRIDFAVECTKGTYIRTDSGKSPVNIKLTKSALERKRKALS